MWPLSRRPKNLRTFLAGVLCCVGGSYYYRNSTRYEVKTTTVAPLPTAPQLAWLDDVRTAAASASPEAARALVSELSHVEAQVASIKLSLIRRLESCEVAKTAGFSS